MTTGDLPALFARRAEILRELATLEERLGAALAAYRAPPAPDQALTLADAARMLGEKPETMRRRLEYRKALLTRPGERRLRYSRAELERILRDRLASCARP